MRLQTLATAFLSREPHPQPALCSESHLLEFGIESENGSTRSDRPVLSQSACPTQARMAHTCKGMPASSPQPEHASVSPPSKFLPLYKINFDQNRLSGPLNFFSTLIGIVW